MSHEIQAEIEKLQRDYTRKLMEIQATQDWDKLPALNEELQKNITQLTTSMTQKAHLSVVKPKSEHYRHTECTLDLDFFVYDGDREYFENFLKNPTIQQFVFGGQRPPLLNSKKELLKTALRLSKGMAPKVWNSIERCQEKLGLNSKIDIYVAQNPSMNAFCYPSHEGCIYILVTSALLEKLNEDELTFVIGHEIGHFLYQHHLMHPGMLMNCLGHELSPAESIRLFSWSRNAELSADRIGLICCGSYEAACTANFKLSSGIASDVLSFSIEEYIKQYEDVENEMKSGDGSPEDFYSTHPISPMRVIALDLFHRSETYCNTFSQPTNADMTEGQMEEKIAGFMKLMEPSYLHGTDDVSQKIKEFIFLGAMAVASADGVVKEEELHSLSQLLTDEVRAPLEESMKDWTPEMMMLVLNEQSEKILPHLTFASMSNIIRDLILVSVADGTLDRKEYEVLSQICTTLNVHPSFIDQILSSINYQQAA